MSTRSRAYRATHSPESQFEPALPELREAVAHRAIQGPEALAALAKTVHMPVASVRGSLSSYTDVQHDPAAVRVCAGTSCAMAGGPAIGREIAKGAGCTPVYCLGYCDRSPAAMTAAGGVIAPVTAADVEVLVHDRPVVHPAPPSVRCEARAAIVTARLLATSAGDPPLPDYAGLRAALGMEPRQVVESVVASGVRGRGGAAYPTGQKWRMAAQARGVPKFVVANGDEGDPGSFIDRELMERDPHGILEGMAICGHAVGADSGVVFIRSEYPRAAEIMERAIADATAAGVLGEHCLGANRSFRVRVVRGMGSYVCGEETALLSAIEGFRGEVRPRPPYPVEHGLYGKPTVVDNVETLVNIPWIITSGADAFAAMGTADSKGTKAVCLNRGFAKPGIVEVEFGVTLREVIERSAGGGAGGQELEAVLLGGPMGSIVTPDQWDAPVCFTAMGRRKINLGHGGLVAIPKGTSWPAMLRHLLTFMEEESCGKCVPCRLGTRRAHEMAKAGLSAGELPAFRRILALMKEASLCAFGRETPGPVETILEKFGTHVVTEARS